MFHVEAYTYLFVAFLYCSPIFHQFHILINNAGRSQRADWNDIDTAVDRDLFELNVFSPVALARHVNRYFEEVKFLKIH